MQAMILPAIFSGSLWEIISDTSGFGLFILLALVFMSLVCWSIIFTKWRQFKQVNHQSKQFVSHFKRTKKIDESLGQAKNYSSSPLSHIYMAGTKELGELSQSKNQSGTLQQNFRPLEEKDFEIVEMAMERTMSEQFGRLEKQVVFLATTGNSAPFMGLLGTVVGIMDSFWAIGERGSASLAVVAPGIAEALLATIVGLGAAIPAVIAYNWANNKLKFLNDDSANFILEFLGRAKKERI
ncbi:MAG TPA: MotA/TolQ/ExbB proton channel family protein [candidate division Zixibacteria bacterium]|nr:MotA/TolQ/ExbB proton channel family protein [candidate division Zixibacteria bacterium]